MSRECRLTTIDNPYDPFEQFDQWFLFDNEKGYATCAYLGRIVNGLSKISDEDDEENVEEAIDSILKNDFLGIYKKVYKNETPRGAA